MKTTIAGIITAAAAFVLFDPELFTHIAWVVPLAKFVTIGGLASTGLLAKDFNTHSTADQVMQATPEPSAPAASPEVK